ncbi:MAG TPA: 50S ribosomal protein L31e [Thermoplasmata archaeon]|nr:50S ribosomal protein L31e [Thermoplasmata archaeon]
MAEEEIERIYTIPLRDARTCPRWRRAPRSMKVIRSFVARHMKVDEESIWIDDSVNERVWLRGAQKPPSKIRVKVTKFTDEGGYVEVTLPEE